MSGAIPWRMTFRLPATLYLLAPEGPHRPCLHGCLLQINRGGLVQIEGPSREQVFEQASRFLRQLTRKRDLPPGSIAARVLAPWGGADSWQIVFGAAVAFSPCRIEPYLPGDEAA